MSGELEEFIAACLDDFYASRINTLEKLSLKKILCRKNPYLFKARDTERASGITGAITCVTIKEFGSRYTAIRPKRKTQNCDVIV